MRNQTLQLYAAGSLEENYSVSLESALQLRPELLNIGRRDYPIRFTPLSPQRRRKFSDPGNDVRSGLQRERCNVSVTLRGGRSELPHRAKHDHSLAACTGALEHSNRGARGPGVGIAGVVDKSDVTDLLPRYAHLRLRHRRDPLGHRFEGDTALACDRDREHGVSQVVQPAERWADDYASKLDLSQAIPADHPAIRLQVGVLIESGNDDSLCFPGRRSNLRLRGRRDSYFHPIVHGGFLAKNSGKVSKSLEVLFGD